LHMNPVLEFALSHQVQTRGLLVGFYGIPQDELDDCAQEVLFKILQADPKDPRAPNAYWWATVRSVAYSCWRRLGQQRHTSCLERLSAREEDDPSVILELREEVAAALAQANQADREALGRLLGARQAPMTPADRVRIHRFRRRLQGAPA